MPIERRDKRTTSHQVRSMPDILSTRQPDVV
jgi:hypothetical protein